MVEQKEIRENLFLAGTIVKPKNNIIPIKLMNTSDADIPFQIFNRSYYL